MPNDPPKPSIREMALSAPPELAGNRYVKFLRTMSAEEEAMLEHLLARDLRELEAETERERAEESAA